MKKTQLMGILNCTPDSFYDGGRYFDPVAALEHGLEMIEQGADLLDIGGESTRPGATVVDAVEEMRRILPLVSALSPQIKVSVDTSKPEVAKAALEQGASFLNDVTGFSDPEMVQLAASHDVEICVMHMKGTPKTMQEAPSYPHGVVEEITEWFKKKIELLVNAGIKPSRIYLDPGIGFGKSLEDNCLIIRNLLVFKALGFPLLLGISRKSFMSKILQKPARELLSTTLAINTISILEGVSIIRVHDVKEHRHVIDVISQIK